MLLLLLAAGTVATAAPAAAAQDPSRPEGSVSRGPSCEPGGVAITVVAGTVPYRVVLATTRRPEGEDAADLAAGGTAVLHTGDIDWGETIDSRLVYTALDGSGATSTDELDDWTMTRPSYEDCAALSAPAPGSAPATGTAAAGSSSPSSAAADATASGTSAPDTGGAAAGGSVPPSGGAGSAAPGPESAAAGPSAVVTAGAAGSDGASSRAVGAGRPITVRGAGFRPGEDVVLRLHGTGAVLASGTAGADGSVQLALTVPPSASGTTDLELVGGTTRTSAPLRLQVAAQSSGVDGGGHPFAVPPLAALLALLTTGGGLVAVLRRAGAVRGGAPGTAASSAATRGA